MVFFVIIMKSTFASMSDIVSQKVIQYKKATILYFYFIFFGNEHHKYLVFFGKQGCFIEK